MKIQKKQFRIGELAKTIGVEQFVIRFWEKEFNVKGIRSEGGQRFYEKKDVEKFRSIKTLLYDQGFTIAGAKKILCKKENLLKNTFLGSPKTDLHEANHIKKTTRSVQFNEKIILLVNQLLDFKELLIDLKKRISS